jgi:hypothetical protein
MAAPPIVNLYTTDDQRRVPLYSAAFRGGFSLSPTLAGSGGIGSDYVPKTAFTDKDPFNYGDYFMKNTKVFAVVLTGAAVAKDNLAI